MPMTPRNMISRVDDLHGLTETFSYDTLDRLTGASLGGGAPVNYGFTFGHNHDSFVDWATRLGLPDSLVTLPSMPPILWMSQWQEIVNAVFENAQPGSAPFEHFHD